MSASVGASPTDSVMALLDARPEERFTTPRVAADSTREPSFDSALDRAGRARPARADRNAREDRQMATRPDRERQDERPQSARTDHPVHPEHPDHPVHPAHPAHPDRPRRSETKPDKKADESDKSTDSASADTSATAVASTAPSAATVQTVDSPADGATGAAADDGDASVSATGGAVAAVSTRDSGANEMGYGAGRASSEAAFDLNILGGLAPQQRRAADSTSAGDNSSASEFASPAAGTAAAVSAAPDGAVTGQQTTAALAEVGKDMAPKTTAAANSPLPSAANGTIAATDRLDSVQAEARSVNRKQDGYNPSVSAKAGAGAASATTDSGAPTDVASDQETADPRAADGSSGWRPDGFFGTARVDPSTGQVTGVRRTDATESNQSATPLTGAERRDAVEQVLERAQLFTTAGGRGATLRLDPPELGMLHVRVVVEAGQVCLRITTETPQARDIIQSGWSKLQEGFAERGLRVEQIVVEQASAGNGVGLGFGTASQGGGSAWGRPDREPDAPFAQSRTRPDDSSNQGRPESRPANGGRGALIDIRV